MHCRNQIVYSLRQYSLLVWKLVGYAFDNYTYLRKDVLCVRSKQFINASRDPYKNSSRINTLFRDQQRNQRRSFLELNEAIYSSSRKCLVLK